MVYLPTFTKNINQMQVNVPYMDGMGDGIDQKRMLVRGNKTRTSPA